MMMPGLDFALVLLALVVDVVAGDPPWLYRRIPHPVVLIGNLIASLERLLNTGKSAVARSLKGIATALIVVTIAGLVGYVLSGLCRHVPGGWLVEAIVASTLIAFRSLYEHVSAVARGLTAGLAEGRFAVAKIVGRDPQSLEEAGVARAAIESLAENFSDGVVAPVFWFVLLGLPGLAAYKAVNTLDSMIGHHSERYEHFGKFAAKLDDAVNYIPARLAGICLVLAALPLPSGDTGGALRSLFTYAPRHRSTNAGWQEAAVAGALGLALAGPRQYADGAVEDAWMGDGRRELKTEDVHRALHLYLWAGVVLAAMLGIAWAVAV